MKRPKVQIQNLNSAPIAVEVIISFDLYTSGNFPELHFTLHISSPDGCYLAPRFLPHNPRADSMRHQETNHMRTISGPSAALVTFVGKRPRPHSSLAMSMLYGLTRQGSPFLLLIPRLILPQTPALRQSLRSYLLQGL